MASASSETPKGRSARSNRAAAQAISLYTVALLTWAALTSCTERNTAPAVDTYQTQLDNCTAKRAALIEQGSVRLATRDFAGAVSIVEECARITQDDELLGIRWKAEAGQIQEELASTPTKATVERLRLLRGLRVRGDEFLTGAQVSELRRLERIEANDEERKAAVAKGEEARRRTAKQAERWKEGVSIGMTEQEVLDSSWGRPEHVNRTITAKGKDEQWVYGDGDYLYFQNGVLRTIQTRDGALGP